MSETLSGPPGWHPSQSSEDALTVKVSLSKLQREAGSGKKRHHGRPKGGRGVVEGVGLAGYGEMLGGGELPDGGYVMAADQVVPSEESFGSKYCIGIYIRSGKQLFCLCYLLLFIDVEPHKPKRKKHSKIGE